MFRHNSKLLGWKLRDQSSASEVVKSCHSKLNPRVRKFPNNGRQPAPTDAHEGASLKAAAAGDLASGLERGFDTDIL
jgi:hypothetical protein